MKKSQLKSILDAQFNDIVIEKFDIKEIRKSIRNLRLQVTRHFKNGQKHLAQIVSKALRNLIAEERAHHKSLVAA